MKPIPLTRQELDAIVAPIARRDGPIVVGPWLSEIGFELLYWIPFLRWLVAAYALDPRRLWVVSRGGCARWYADITPRYLDIFDWVSPDDFRRCNVARVAAARRDTHRTISKQYDVSPFDEAILAQATAAIGAMPDLIHPSVMYRFFRECWLSRTWDRYDAHTHIQRFIAPLWGHPRPYVAMKWYSSQACPATDESRRAIATIVETVTATTDLLLLEDATRYDDHGSCVVPPHPRVHRVPLTPRTNLATQTAVIAGASHFVGTYGGFGYLAPMLGVPTLGVYGVDNFRRDHYELVRRLCAGVLQCDFTVKPLRASAGWIRRHWDLGDARAA